MPLQMQKLDVRGAAQDQHHAHEADLSGLQVELQRALSRAEAAEAEVAARPTAEELRRVLQPNLLTSTCAACRSSLHSYSPA